MHLPDFRGMQHPSFSREEDGRDILVGPIVGAGRAANRGDRNPVDARPADRAGHAAQPLRDRPWLKATRTRNPRRRSMRALKRHVTAESPGSNGDRISASASGARCARTTARTATPGTTSPTIRRARAPITGARTASPGFSDDQQRLCFALALWNGKDPILKERLFGLTNSEGNHGEDVKEYYFYLDSTPTHSYMKYPLQISAGGLSLRRSGRDQPAARPQRHGI